MLKDEIIKLKEQGVIQSQIAKLLNCSTGTVSYHLNPGTKEKALQRKRRNKKPKELHQYLDKEIHISVKKVCWRYAEAICTARLIELGYEVFTPFNGGGEIDLVVFKDGTLSKVQIKSISPTNTSFISLSPRRNGCKNPTPYKNIDFFLLYDGSNLYKLNGDETIITLRYTVPKNNQMENVRMAYDYIFSP